MSKTKISTKPSKIALVLAGGGLAGGVYELGALRAINDLLVNQTVNDFDIYVGTSAGSLVAAGLAKGLTPQTMIQAIEGDHPELRRLRRRDLFSFNSGELFQRMLHLPRTLFGALRHYQKHPGDINVIDILWSASDTLPSALYDGSALANYVRDMLEHSGQTDSFEQTERALYIIATELSSGERVVFGADDNKQVPISQAVAASSALPLVYSPVEIDGLEYVDGGLRGNASLDLAIEMGAKLVVCINPLVPYKNRKKGHKKMSDLGMQAVADQSLRIMMHSGLHYHVKQMRRRHPEVDIILIEPSDDDYMMMFSNMMRYSTRMSIARHGYESVTLSLTEKYHRYKEGLARHGFEISAKNVIPALEKLQDAGEDADVVLDILEHEPLKPRANTKALTQVLNSLEAALNRS